ncbi:hypothetical protein B9479_003348 [Cryptococcus floricola]|uniref:Uncharacterized protein n=1 Tax=Cryptococcus floricola TaxID=2591691 RepID=A0A5D3B0U1_9TREE|nr:hypothetical protein B9479_003348 [Cryptococcus floricola]
MANTATNLNDTSMSPQGVQGAYPGVQNVIEPSEPAETYVKSTGPPRDVIEGKEGVIEGSQLAPLGEDKIASDPGLVTAATAMAKKAYTAVAGEQ